MRFKSGLMARTNSFWNMLIFSPQIGELKPATSYVFLVRAENVHGLSEPSPLSAIVRTLGIESGNVPQTELAAARIVLSGKVILPCSVLPAPIATKASKCKQAKKLVPMLLLRPSLSHLYWGGRMSVPTKLPPDSRLLSLVITKVNFTVGARQFVCHFTEKQTLR